MHAEAHQHRFDPLNTHGFGRTAAAVPHVRVADPAFNAERTIALARLAAEQDAALAVFPELGISSYALHDLLRQQALLDRVRHELGRIAEATAQLAPVIVVGAPLLIEGGVFNTAIVI